MLGGRPSGRMWGRCLSYVRVVQGASCQRVSSVAVLVPGTPGGFEFGYLIGWWGNLNCAGVDENHFYQRPTLFALGIDTDGDYYCLFWENRHPTEAQYDYFRASDTNKNSYWGGFWNGTEQNPDGFNMDFSAGVAVVNMERGAASDSGYARFDYIEEFHYQGNLWTYTDDLRRGNENHDPDYHIEFPNQHTAKMLHD